MAALMPLILKEKNPTTLDVLSVDEVSFLRLGEVL